MPGSSNLRSLIDKLQHGTPHIGIYGLGYVGLPLALRFAEVERQEMPVQIYFR